MVVSMLSYRLDENLWQAVLPTILLCRCDCMTASGTDGIGTKAPGRRRVRAFWFAASTGAFRPGAGVSNVQEVQMKIAQPREGEPIQLVITGQGEPRYRVVIDGDPFPNGRRRQLRSTHRTLTAARAHVAAHRVDRERGNLLVPDRRTTPTFAAFADAWLSAREADGHIRPNTAVGYRSALRRAEVAFGPKQIVDVSDVDVESLARSIAAAGRTQRSCAFTLFVVRAVFKEAMRRRLIVRNPAEFVEASGRDSKRREAMSRSDLAKLHDHLRDDPLYACWLLTLNGLRRSEVMGLRWSDVDLEHSTLTISHARVDVNGRSVVGKPKTARGTRTLPLPSQVVHTLREMRSAQAKALGRGQVKDGYLAVNPAGEPLRPEVWTREWRRHCAAAGVAPVSLHAARHTSVTVLRDAGVADHLVAAWHGHDEVVMRRTYSHAALDELTAVGSALARAMTSPSPGQARAGNPGPL